MLEASRTKWEKYTKIILLNFFPTGIRAFASRSSPICRGSAAFGVRWESLMFIFRDNLLYYQPFAFHAVGGRSGELLHAYIDSPYGQLMLD